MEEKIKNILDNGGIIVLDTNVYLNIYDRSPEYSDFSLRVLEIIKNSILLPSTVVREFTRNHRECFGRQRKKIEKACTKLVDQLNTTKTKIDNQCQVIKTFEFPDIDNIQNRINALLDDAISVVNEYSEEHQILEIINDFNMKEDSVCRFVYWLIANGKILPEFNVDSIYELTQAADRRYEKSVPPGFKDRDKNEGLHKYGDYFIWEQVLRWAAQKKAPVIFVTDDVKSDWYESNGTELVFHSILCEEFKNRVGTDFIGMNSREFFSAIASLNGIEKPNALVCALEFTSKKYVEELVDRDVIYDCLEQLLYSGENYVDMDSLSASATEGLEVSDDLEDVEFVGYEVGIINNGEITYYLTFNVKTTAVSYEYWGRDDDTKRGN